MTERPKSEDRPTPFGPVLVIGTGLIGASLGRLVREAYPAATVMGVDRPEVAREAAERGHVTEGYDLERTERLLAEAGLVFVATPLPAILELLPRLAAGARAGTVVIDTGSTKSEVCLAAARQEGFASGRVAFIGGHPMSGARHAGVGAADPALLRGAPFVLCPLPGVGAEVLARVEAFLKELSLVPVRLAPEDHDEVVAATSHVPHLLAALLANHVGSLAETRPHEVPPHYEIAGGGLDRMTAKAAAPPEMWAETVQSNARPIVRHLRALSRELLALAELVEAGRVHGFLKAARDRRAIFELTNYRYREATKRHDPRARPTSPG